MVIGWRIVQVFPNYSASASDSAKLEVLVKNSSGFAFFVLATLLSIITSHFMCLAERQSEESNVPQSFGKERVSISEVIVKETKSKWKSLAIRFLPVGLLGFVFAFLLASVFVDLMAYEYGGLLGFALHLLGYPNKTYFSVFSLAMMLLKYHTGINQLLMIVILVLFIYLFIYKMFDCFFLSLGNGCYSPICSYGHFVCFVVGSHASSYSKES